MMRSDPCRDARACRMYLAKTPARVIARNERMTTSGIFQLLKRCGVRPRQNHLRGRAQAIRDHYIRYLYAKGYSTPRIGRALDCVPSTIFVRMREIGMPLRTMSEANANNCRKYFPDESVFDRRGGEASYWGGFLLADGAICGPTLHLALMATDIEHIRKLRRFLGLGNDCPIRVHSNSRGFGVNDIAKFSVRSQRIVSALAKFGVVPRKTHIASVPLALRNDRDFWRGLVDGDGWVRMENRAPYANKPQIGLCGTLDICEQFSALCLRVNMRKACVKRNGKIWTAELNGFWAVPILRWLYERNSVALDRKNVRAQWIIARSWPKPKTDPLPLTFKGRTQTIGQWAKEVGLRRVVLYLRIIRGWSVRRALQTPKQKRRLLEYEQASSVSAG